MKTGGSGAMFNTGAAARGGSPHKFGDQRYASSSCGVGVRNQRARSPPGRGARGQNRSADAAAGACAPRAARAPRAPPSARGTKAGARCHDRGADAVRPTRGALAAPVANTSQRAAAEAPPAARTRNRENAGPSSTASRAARPSPARLLYKRRSSSRTASGSKGPASARR